MLRSSLWPPIIFMGAWVEEMEEVEEGQGTDRHTQSNRGEGRRENKVVFSVCIFIVNIY